MLTRGNLLLFKVHTACCRHICVIFRRLPQPQWNQLLLLTTLSQTSESILQCEETRRRGSTFFSSPNTTVPTARNSLLIRLETEVWLPLCFLERCKTWSYCDTLQQSAQLLERVTGLKPACSMFFFFLLRDLLKWPWRGYPAPTLLSFSAAEKSSGCHFNKTATELGEYIWVHACKSIWTETLPVSDIKPFSLTSKNANFFLWPVLLCAIKKRILHSHDFLYSSPQI